MNKQKSSRIKKIIRPVSRLRKAYIARLVGRCVILAGCISLSVPGSSEFELLDGMNFFSRFSVLHILWGIWMIDMICQLIPVKHMPLGSQKLFRERFRPVHREINHSLLKDYIMSTTKAACEVFALWTALIAVIGALFYTNIINRTVLFLISVFFLCV